MLTFLASLHAVAARRGDGLRPELANLLERGATALFHRIRRDTDVTRTGKQGPRRPLVRGILG